MKFFSRFCLVIFSLIILILSTTIILMSIGVIDVNLFTIVLSALIKSQNTLRLTIVLSVILFIISFRFVFFKIEKDENTKDGIIMENANGKLIISKESLENMILSSTKVINGIEYVSSKTLIDKDHNLMINVTILVGENVIIKDVTNMLQDKIKQTMKDTADLQVGKVIVDVKNIVTKKNKSEKVVIKKEEKKEEKQEETNKE